MTDETIQFSATCELIEAAADSAKKTPSIRMVAYDGGIMAVGGYRSLVIDLAGADVSGDLPILQGHGESLDDIVGTGKASIAQHQIHVQGIITDATPAGQRVIALGRSGVMPQASIGFQPSKREYVTAGSVVRLNGRSLTAGEDGLTVIRTGRLREISLVPIGASPGTSVSISAKGQRSMAQDSQNKIDEDKIKAQMTAELAWNQPGLSDPERVQARWISEQRQFHDRETVGPFGRAQSAMIAASAGKITYGDFERQLLISRCQDSELRAIRAERPRGPAIHSSSRDGGGDVLEAALLCHLGHDELVARRMSPELAQRGKEARIHTAMDFVRASLEAAGREIPTGRDDMIRAAFSTTTTTGILGAAANKLLEDSYRAFPSAARIVARKLSANDFKTHTGYRLTGDAVFHETGPAAEIHHGVLAEASYTFSVKTYARMFGITRQDVINDDLGAFDEIPRMLGRGAAIALEELFWTLVLANTGSFFAGGNANYISGGDSALSSTGLGDAVETMLKQVDQDSHPINVVPRYLLVPPELKKTADELYRSTTVNTGGAATATQVPNASVFFGLYEPIVSPYLSNASFSGYSTTAWYLFGSPSDVAAFGIAFLNGVDAPTIEQMEAPSNMLGVHWRGYQDFGVCQVDHRGAVMSAGA